MLFKDVAAKWASKGANYQLALGMVTELEKNTKSAVTKGRLKKRVQRLQNLIMLEDAMAEYELQYNKKPKDIKSLVERGMISSVPIDPWEAEYIFSSGRISVKESTNVR
jgi:competence protein ComGC